MARRITPDSGAGNARLTIGRSGPNSGRTQPVKISNATMNKIYKAMSQPKTTRITTDSIIGKYKNIPQSNLKPLKSFNSTTSNNYSIPVGLGIIGGAAVIGSNAAKNRAKQEAIKKASVKTRKGQSRGR